MTLAMIEAAAIEILKASPLAIGCWGRSLEMGKIPSISR